MGQINKTKTALIPSVEVFRPSIYIRTMQLTANLAMCAGVGDIGGF